MTIVMDKIRKKRGGACIYACVCVCMCICVSILISPIADDEFINYSFFGLEPSTPDEFSDNTFSRSFIIIERSHKVFNTPHTTDSIHSTCFNTFLKKAKSSMFST